MEQKIRFWSVGFLVLTLLMASSGPGAVHAADPYDPNVLSYGIYWFGLDNVREKFVAGEDNPYFDPAKPTVLFIHGWQPTISATYPPNFDYVEGGNVNTANAWIAAGWNIGIFYWNQFSDEPDDVKYAEAKIWTPNGSQGMRWRKSDGTYADAPVGTPSAGELLYEAYVAALTEAPYTGGNIRIAGHSLGNQMATRLTKLVSEGIAAGEVPEHLLPTRVTLLDPYWSIGAKDYLGGKDTGTVVREYISALLHEGVLFEWYHSSNLTVEPAGYANAELQRMMLYAEMTPDFVTDEMSKHCAAWNLYFWSYAFDGPADCSGNGCLAMNKLLAKMSDAQLASVMRSDYTWAQNAGSLTPTPADDTYQSSPRDGTPYRVTGMSLGLTTHSIEDGIALVATVMDNTLLNPVDDGTLVAFGTDLGFISQRVATQGGAAIAYLHFPWSAVRGMQSNPIGIQQDVANVWATTEGSGGTPQFTLPVPAQSPSAVPALAMWSLPVAVGALAYALWRVRWGK